VSRVAEGGVAAEAGLAVGDKLLAVSTLHRYSK
jgi:predicted metalloprotease with PDZ domain